MPDWHQLFCKQGELLPNFAEVGAQAVPVQKN
jgi:hypothetical protein